MRGTFFTFVVSFRYQFIPVFSGQGQQGRKGRGVRISIAALSSLSAWKYGEYIRLPHSTAPYPPVKPLKEELQKEITEIADNHLLYPGILNFPTYFASKKRALLLKGLCYMGMFGNYPLSCENETWIRTTWEVSLMITGHRIRSLERHLWGINRGDVFVMGLADIHRFEDVLQRIGFSQDMGKIKGSGLNI